MKSGSIRRCVQGESAEWNLYCLEYNVLEWSILGEKIGDLIRNSTVEI
jgi:hypothetical protein